MRHHTANYGAGVLAAAADGFFGQRQPTTKTDVKEDRHALSAPGSTGTYPVEVKRELATRLCKLYAELMETQLWRPNVGFAELGQDNLYRLGLDGLETITMVLVEFTPHVREEMLRDGDWVADWTSDEAVAG